MSIHVLIPPEVGAGYDDVDVTAAYKHGVSVTHTPGAVDDATATTAIFLILSAMRRFWAAEQSCRAGNWKKGLPLARDPEGKTLGIVGMGGIGKVVARRMTGWGMKIVYYNRRELDPKPDFECEYKSSLEDLLKVSDVVSLHMPVSTPQLYHPHPTDTPS
jgi:glyoxylate reductase